VFDPQTRTAEMEIEVPNPGFRLKPGMYSRVDLTVDSRQNALTVPSNAVVDFEGKTGVFVAGSGQAAPGPDQPSASGQAPARAGGPQQASNPPPGGPLLTAKFQPVQIGIRDGEQVEITSGLDDGARVITTGATALRDGDRIVASGGRNREQNTK
jgi:multidrug efflux pump subunit AcrA (membrane-fusion protein)